MVYVIGFVPPKTETFILPLFAPLQVIFVKLVVSHVKIGGLTKVYVLIIAHRLESLAVTVYVPAGKLLNVPAGNCVLPIGFGVMVSTITPVPPDAMKVIVPLFWL